MSRIYLVRHGQAGTRDSYDLLSELGRRQARLLGQYFASQGIRFAAAYAGGMARQQQTAREVSAAYAEAGAAFPEIGIERGWDEFDLDQVYRELAPKLCEEDPEFRCEYEAMLAEIQGAREEPGAGIHRRWTPCDVKIVGAWTSGRHTCEGETWEAFRERIAGCRALLDRAGSRENIAVFTSATPIGIWTASAMDITDQRALRLAGVLYNASYTLLRLRGGELRLHAFNAVPHFTRPELFTYR